MDYIKENKNNIKVILLDYMMPGKSGAEVMESIRENKELRSIAIVIQTGIVDKNEINKIISKGADAILQKPYDKKQLLEVVNRFND